MSNSFDYNFLNAALNAVMSDRNFVTEKEFKDRKARYEIGNVVYENIEINSFHQYNLVGGRMPSKSTNNNTKIDLKISIKTLSGESYILCCKGSHTIDRLKRKISEKKGIPPDRQKLIFNGCELQNGLTLIDYNISNNSIIYLVRHLKGEESIISCLNPNDLDQTYNRDFTNVNDERKIFIRGGFRYLRPCGWKRIALKVTKKYDNGDDRWLGTDNYAWPVSYHGTARRNAKSISEDGYLLSKGQRFAFGHGIYTTPDIEVARRYAQEFTYEGKRYALVFQNRVNPMNLQRIDMKKTGRGEYWISKRGEDVRPYGICFKEIENDITSNLSTNSRIRYSKSKYPRVNFMSNTSSLPTNPKHPTMFIPPTTSSLSSLLTILPPSIFPSTTSLPIIPPPTIYPSIIIPPSVIPPPTIFSSNILPPIMPNISSSSIFTPTHPSRQITVKLPAKRFSTFENPN
ncbi:hypothetical protein C2G38_1530146 [Gigaspora rosea]|uniref:Ubiquitin-like domain-containing protein n=1 Tax=Gigaspora rosea TaxID=44941 RepID=A0A397V191_9GLOM|nr:hypothetical protein C2G38_1530146 [Gigaspora rosea]